MLGNLIRRFGAPSPRPAAPVGGRQITVWIAAPVQDADSQTLIRGAQELDLLVGTGLATAIGPYRWGQQADHHEFLLRIPFLRCFSQSPQVTPFVISTQPTSRDPAICALAVRTVTADCFTLALSPQFGCPSMDVEFGWVGPPGKPCPHAAPTDCKPLICHRNGLPMKNDDHTRSPGLTGFGAAKIGLPGLLRVLDTVPSASLRALRAGARTRLAAPADASPEGVCASPDSVGVAGKAPCA